MSDSALMRQVPIEDRRRELIAARHIMPVRRLYGTSETPQPESDILPVFLSSDEVIGLLAYGRTRALDGPVSNAPRMFERWSSPSYSSHPPDSRLIRQQSAFGMIWIAGFLSWLDRVSDRIFRRSGLIGRGSSGAHAPAFTSVGGSRSRSGCGTAAHRDNWQRTPA